MSSTARSAAFVGLGALALFAWARRSTSPGPKLPPLRVQFPPPNPPQARPPITYTPLSPEWQRARLTEYHPDTPASAGRWVLRREGGRFDRSGQKVLNITLEQHRADPLRYPYASVAADLILQGREVPYGVRVYIEALPNDVLRIVDTGGNFFGSDKKIREPGHEPLDIATAWPGKTQRLSGRLTRYRIDWEDRLPIPRTRIT